MSKSKTMTSMLNQFWRWMMEPEVWRFVCFVSSIVGMFCYALSSSFNHLFGNWNLWKIILYTVLSFFICVAILFANKWQNSNASLPLKAHLVFCVFAITTVYAFFFDKINGKPDGYSLVSSAAFAIMSLGLSKQSCFGFEVDLLLFFCGCLTAQLMKINLFLALAGLSFSYPLVILRFYLRAPAYESVQNDQVSEAIIQIPAEYSNELINTAEYYHAIQVDDFQVNSDSDGQPEIGEHGLYQQDSLALVNQINSPSQQDNIRESDRNKLDHYKKVARQNLTWLEDFLMNKLRITVADGFLTQRPGLLFRVLKSENHIWISAKDNSRKNLLSLINLPIPRSPAGGIRHRGSKLRRQKLKEMLDGAENNDVDQDNNQKRLLEYHNYLYHNSI
jgi:hypothetical protein